MKVQKLVLVVYLALLTFAFSVVFTIATLAGLSIPSALAAGAAAIVALSVVMIVASLLPATIVQEERLTIRAPREAVYAAIADPRPGPRRTPAIVAVDGLVGEPGATGSRWRTRFANGAVFTAEVVTAEPPARLVIRSRNVPRRPRRRVVVETERTLTATPAGTEVAIRSAMHTVLVVRLVERLQSSQAERLRRWGNDRFRDELEAGAATREVGRTVGGQ
jgi:uncharacterized protein YndB with AHSA1/START domain